MAPSSRRSRKIVGFHIDMNTAHFRRRYLEKWLKELAEFGYNTLVWEVENMVQWESCPASVSPDAFSKKEFQGLLNLSRDLGMEPIPLFQILAHSEYVLKHDEYRDLREMPGAIDQYCPLHPKLKSFLKTWLEEYLDLFGKVRFFHLGADETWSLGKCPKCKAFARRHSLSALYLQHVRPLCNFVLKKGIRPVLWADMMLTHPELAGAIPIKTVLCDWMYDIYRGSGKVWIWGKGNAQKHEIPPEHRKRFEAFLFPKGDEPGRDPETFYTADFLSSQGYDVLTCPGSSSFGDNIFAPRTWYHMRNTFDSSRKGHEDPLAGSILTSWTVHQFPWELQRPCIRMPGHLKDFPEEPLDGYAAGFTKSEFGTEMPEFWKAASMLSNHSLFTFTSSLGIRKTCLPPSPNVLTGLLDKHLQNKTIGQTAEHCLSRSRDYGKAARIFRSLGRKARKRKGVLAMWEQAAQNLRCRAEISAFLLETHGKKRHPRALLRARKLLAASQRMRKKTRKMFDSILRPHRADEVVQWAFDPIEKLLEAKTR